MRLDGKSASINSISECIQSSNASSFSIRSVPFLICTLSFFGLRPTASTAASYCAGLYDADKNELGEADVVIGGEKSNQANNAAGR